MKVEFKYIALFLVSICMNITYGNTHDRFRLESRSGRDCLVHPDGTPFFSLGVNHIQNILQKTNRGEVEQVCEEAYENLKKWGFNTAGYGSPRALCKRMPYFAPIYLTKNAHYHGDHEFDYPDVFDPAVQEQFRETIEDEILQQENHPNLIGYYWTDTPQWDLKRTQETRGTDWVSAIRQLPEDAPGKIRYREFMESHDTSDEAFLRLIARELYRVIGEETRRLAPDTLIFGERYLIHDHPACVVEEALPYIDVLSIQPGGAIFPATYFDELYALYQKPILLCDHQCSFPTSRYAKTMWQQMKSEDAAGKAYAVYVNEAVHKPYILGYQRCQYIDVFETHIGVLKQGILQEDQSPYKTLAEHVSRANQIVLKIFEAHVVP